MVKQFRQIQSICFLLAAAISIFVVSCANNSALTAEELSKKDAAVVDNTLKHINAGEYKEAIDEFRALNKEVGLTPEQEVLLDKSIIKYAEQLKANGEGVKAIEFLKSVPKVSQYYDDAQKILKEIESEP